MSSCIHVQDNILNPYLAKAWQKVEWSIEVDLLTSLQLADTYSSHLEGELLLGAITQSTDVPVAPKVVEESHTFQKMDRILTPSKNITLATKDLEHVAKLGFG